MAYIKWFFIAAFWVLVLAFLHYTLPQHDIARITDTYERRVDPGENRWFWSNAATGDSTTAQGRDVFFIQTRLASDDVMVYRNEDTGWGWPPYFKFDTSNLQAEAADVRSTAAAPQWVAIKHYGWRNEFLSIFPNAISVKTVTGPDVRIIPWTNIIILTLLVAFSWAVYVRWRRFRASRIDPALDEMGDNISDAGGWLKGLFRR
ncbi:hypothetical protein AL036_07330 [Salipiger aestuarii]|uniref:Uncharacterized protein DUF1523 n=1 Tax=Salipiger aestuarii TaxID=568098 RepID=A0A327YGE3_9RHOB|nr:DUF1523 family protein [Salipiger aestuarii]EIE51516.1 hypothetical protein C357_08366 [Citreicella sp. 357]KAA8608465.1 hypothetical protein AL036_07330 [Salipiger aestuarii]KAA8612257.1 hypothetical protein AL037_07435 [Salipiger aestuarii]KAB2541385.1 hypothetical protein AL035_12600 [Salipiger aestuarii]RAK20040.1 uncharacterized protein DUF1523 [Salipiger aestuarii]